MEVASNGQVTIGVKLAGVPSNLVQSAVGATANGSVISAQAIRHDADVNDRRLNLMINGATHGTFPFENYTINGAWPLTARVEDLGTGGAVAGLTTWPRNPTVTLPAGF